jgi:hypothetical protein
MILKDGLYRVVTDYFVAGFIIKNGRVIKWAPILNRKIDYWIFQAEWVCD